MRAAGGGVLDGEVRPRAGTPRDFGAPAVEEGRVARGGFASAPSFQMIEFQESLPALVPEARLSIAPLVLDVAVAVAIAVAVDPLERGARVRLERAHEAGVARPALVLVQEHEEERRRVRGAEVRRMRALAEVRELAEANLVQDLAGLFVPEVVPLGSMSGGEDAERRAREL